MIASMESYRGFQPAELESNPGSTHESDLPGNETMFGAEKKEFPFSGAQRHLGRDV